jgi:PAS domain S-box-containing protein
MNVFALSSLVTSEMTALLGIFALYKNPRGALNRAFFLYCWAGSFASFAEFGYRQAESFTTASFWLRVSSLALLAAPFEVHFVLCLTKKTKLLESKLTYLLLYVPALVFFVSDLMGLTGSQPVQAYWGWTYASPQRGLLLELTEAWFIACGLGGFSLCLHYYLRGATGRRRQIGFVTIGISLPIALAVTSQPGGLFDYLNVEFPELTSVGFALESVLLTYAIWKHELLALTPATAAEKIIATLADALFLVNYEGRIVTVNTATLELLGYEESELVDQPVGMILAQEEIAGFERMCLEQLQKVGSVHDAEITAVTKDGKRIPVSLSASVVRDEEGAERGVIYVGRDLTERKQAEEQTKASLREKEVLLREIHHRVKNNLQIVSSLLVHQAGHVSDKQALEALEESRNRVYSMGVIHEVLYQSQELAQVDFAEFTQRLADHLFHAYRVDSQAITLRMNIFEVSLSIDTAIYCGLIINELVSNSLKHAFPAGCTGEICIGLHSDDENQLILTVSDNGVGLPPGVELCKPESLGLQLIAMFAEQLEGTIELDRSGGMAFTIVFRQ